MKKEESPIFFPQEAESFFAHDLPIYANERKELSIRIISTIILFVFLIPYVATEILYRRKTKKDEEEESQNELKKEKAENVSSSKEEVKVDEEEITTDDGKMERLLVLPWYCMPILNLCAFYFVGVLILTSSSNNRKTPRAIYEAPLFTPKECDSLVNTFGKKIMVNDVGNEVSFLPTDKNYASWDQTETDFLLEKLDSRLSPLIERIYGVTPRSIQAEELSIYRYDPNNYKHKDDYGGLGDQTSNPSTFVFSVLLQDEGLDASFTSSRFFHRARRVHVNITPKVGSVLIHDGSLAYQLNAPPLETSGSASKYIMKGKVSINMVDYRNKATGLHAYASWLSLTWLEGKSIQGSKGELMDESDESRYNWIINSEMTKFILGKAAVGLQIFTDHWVAHDHLILVQPSLKHVDDGEEFVESDSVDGTPTEEKFINVLDTRKVQVAAEHKSNWFGVKVVKEETEVPNHDEF